MSWLIELMIMILIFDVAWELWLELVPVLYRNRKGQCDVRTFPKYVINDINCIGQMEWLA